MCVTAAAVAAAAGCHGAKAPPVPRMPTFPVTGSLQVGGKPAAGAIVTFNPEGRADWKGPFPTAFTAADGSFSAQTYGSADGAPAGAYRITVEWPEGSADDGGEPVDRLAGRHAQAASSTIMVTVDAAPTALKTISLP